MLLLGAPLVARAQGDQVPTPPKTPDDTVVEAGIDVSWFFQADAGGNPVQREGVRYVGERAFLNAQITEAVKLRAAVAVADLEDGGSDDSVDFSQITNATMTEPSQHQTPVTATLFADVRPEESSFTITPGLYVFHQDDYRSLGGSLDASWELNGGDTVPFLGLRLLHDTLELNAWDGRDRGDDSRFTFSVLGGVTQVLSPALLSSVSLQYVHQQGFLGDPINVVPIYTNGIPTFLADERLPRRRDRFQLNGRLRYSLAKGWSLGLDASGYLDTWSVQHTAIEPSFEAALVEDVLIVRFWYRLALQGKARYHHTNLTQQRRRQTRDSDLGTFTVHGVGGLLILRSPYALGGVFPELHANIFYYDRNDGVDGFEYSGGVVARF